MLSTIFFVLAESATIASPLTPSELLIALHGIESKSDMKAVMKGMFFNTRYSSLITLLLVISQFDPL